MAATKSKSSFWKPEEKIPWRIQIPTNCIRRRSTGFPQGPLWISGLLFSRADRRKRTSLTNCLLYPSTENQTKSSNQHKKNNLIIFFSHSFLQNPYAPLEHFLAYCQSLPPHLAWPLLQKADSKINHHIILTRVELLPNFYRFTGKKLLPIYR